MATVLPFVPQSAFSPSVDAKKACAAPATGNRFPKYLAQRKGVYYFKRKVPANLVHEFGNQGQIWKSLYTTDFLLACRELSKEVAAFELQIAAVRQRMVDDGRAAAPASKSMPLSADMVPILVQRYYVHMLDREEQELHTIHPLRLTELAQRIAEADDMLQHYRLALTCGDYTAVDETVAQLLAGEGLSARPGSAVRMQFSKELLLAEVNILKEQRARLDGNMQPTPEMPLPIRLQPTLVDYLTVWKQAEVRPLKTVETTSRMVRLRVEIMGDMPASSITYSLAIDFRDKLINMQLSAATIRNRLGLLRAVVNSYFREERLQSAHNPFDKIPVKDKGQRLRVEKVRRAFELWELNTIYRDPVFAEHAALKGQPREAGYWAPLMAPYVGARIEEIAQMRLVDIEIINGVWTLRICNLDTETQGLKTPSSFRRVPIHQELIRLGFLRYVCEQKRAGGERLFPSLKCDNKYGRWSNALGKWFGRFLHKLDLTSSQLDYHSFRYNFKQRLTQCGVADEVRDALLGHWLTKEKGGKVYMQSANQQYNFPALCKAIEELRYDELDLSYLYVDKPFENVDANLFVR